MDAIDWPSAEAQEVDTIIQNQRPEYPPRVHYKAGFKTPHHTLVREALSLGLDPNTLWAKEDLIVPHPTSGCVAYGISEEEFTWSHWNTPLHFALHYSDYDSARIILQYGGDLNIYNDRGNTPIHEAIRRQCLDDLTFLALHGADFNKLTQDGLHPLHLAIQNANATLFFALLENGAEIQAAIHFEWSVVDLALLASANAILERLMSSEHGFSLVPTPMVHPLLESQRQRRNSEDSRCAARSLLASVSSNQLFPAPDLYETYHDLVSSLNLSVSQNWDANAIDNMVENTTNALHQAANVPRLSLTENFCSSCRNFQLQARQYFRDEAGTGSDAYPDNFQVHGNRQELEQCAPLGCPLCALAADCLRAKGRTSTSDDEDGSSPVLFGLASLPSASAGSNEIDTLFIGLAGHDTKLINLDVRGLNARFGLDTNATKDGAIEKSTGSTHALQIAKQWIQACKSSPEHASCQQAYQDNWGTLPTRVVHVGSEDKGPFLFESGGIKGSYCILSYCWGRPGNAITTTMNLSDRTRGQGIPLASLPAMLCQAILAARSLGYKYIWIDALCIIQDDVDDWAREASEMHKYYSGADVTITSLVASDSRDDLFQGRKRTITRPIPLDLGLPKRHRPEFQEGEVFEMAVHLEHGFESRTEDQAPVDQRAWTLQEQLLSTRILFFGAGILHWTCLANYHLEHDPSGGVNLPMQQNQDYKSKAKCIIKGLPQKDKSISSGEDTFWVWQTQVEEFTRRHLTKPSDRIPAFLAVSKMFQPLLDDQFAGGIWTGSRLIESLCWGLKKPATTRPWGPTWTWTSHSGETSYHYLRHGGERTQKASVVTCDIATDMFGSQVYGSITLRGTLGRLLDDGGIPMFGTAEAFDNVSGSLDSCYSFDMLEYEQAPPHEGIGYPVYPHGKPASVVRLLLQPVNARDTFQTASIFKRIGIVGHPEVSLNEAIEELHYYRWKEGIIQEVDADRVVTIVG